MVADGHSQAVKKFPFLSKFQGLWPVMVVLRSYFTNQHIYKASGKRRQRGDDADDSGPGEVEATRHGERQGDGATDDEVTDDEVMGDEEEPVLETRKRKAGKSSSQDYRSLHVPVH